VHGVTLTNSAPVSFLLRCLQTRINQWQPERQLLMESEKGGELTLGKHRVSNRSLGSSIPLWTSAFYAARHPKCEFPMAMVSLAHNCRTLNPFPALSA
jgi:hypothetical protein